MPADRSKYPRDWFEIAELIKEKAGWRCEACGIGHEADGTRGSVLTVHHPNRDPGNPHAEMKAFCARCHLKDEARARRVEKYRNQRSLFPGLHDPPWKPVPEREEEGQSET